MNNECDISYQQRVDYHDKKLNTEERVWLEQHIEAGCILCRDSMVQIAQIVGALHASQLSHAPQSVLNRAYALFRPHMATQSLVQHIASLIFDSRTNQRLSFVRGEQSEAVQRLYETDRHRIDLWEEPQTEQRSYIIGQVAHKEDEETIAPMRVIAYTETGDGIEARLDSGEFHLPALTSGRYDIEVLIGEGEIFLAGIVVGE